MKRLVGSRAVRCACLIACVSCADALGLHDLVQGHTDGDQGQSGASGDGGEADLSPGLAIDADSLEASAPTASAVDATGSMASDTTTDGALGAEPGNSPDSGSSGPAMTDVGRVMSAGMAEAGPAPPDAGGPPGPGGAANACGCPGCVAHSNGTGQTFQDCAPRGTFDSTQALAACAAFTGSSTSCAVESCSGEGSDKTGDQAACSAGMSACNCWVFAGTDVGLVQSEKPNKCQPCGTSGTAWN